MSSASSDIRVRDSIKVRTLAVTLLLALAGVGFAAGSLYSAVCDLREAKAMAATSEALATLSRATTELSLERSASQLSIEMPGVVQPQIRQLIDEQRRKAELGFQQVLRQSAALSTTAKGEEFRRALSGLLDSLRPLRREFDRLNAMPLANRPSTVVQTLPRELKATVAALQAQRHLLRGTGFMLPSEVAILEAVRDQAWQIREYGGRERTYLAIAAASGEPISEPRLEEMAELARRASDAWLDITRLTTHEGVPSGVLSAVRVVEQGYFGRYDEVRRAMLAAAGKAGAGYPLDLDRYFAQSSEALRGAEELAAAASAAIDVFWTARAGATLQAVVVNGVAALLLVGAGLVGSFVSLNAFYRLNALGARMRALAGGEVASEVPHATARDEVGAMARAVLVFRETAADRIMLETRAANEQAEKDRRQAASEQHTRGSRPAWRPSWASSPLPHNA